MVEISQLWNQELYKDKEKAVEQIFQQLINQIEDPAVLQGTSFRYREHFFFLRSEICDGYPFRFQLEDWAENIIAHQITYHDELFWKSAMHKYLTTNIMAIIKESYSLTISDNYVCFGLRKIR